jgi:hypothetical protein
MHGCLAQPANEGCLQGGKGQLIHPRRLACAWRVRRVTRPRSAEQHARGGGCVCKIPPGELEETIGRLVPDGPSADLMVESSTATTATWCG